MFRSFRRATQGPWVITSDPVTQTLSVPGPARPIFRRLDDFKVLAFAAERIAGAACKLAEDFVARTMRLIPHQSFHPLQSVRFIRRPAKGRTAGDDIIQAACGLRRRRVSCRQHKQQVQHGGIATRSRRRVNPPPLSQRRGIGSVMVRRICSLSRRRLCGREGARSRLRVCWTGHRTHQRAGDVPHAADAEATRFNSASRTGLRLQRFSSKARSPKEEPQHDKDSPRLSRVLIGQADGDRSPGSAPAPHSISRALSQPRLAHRCINTRTPAAAIPRRPADNSGRFTAVV